MNPRFSADSENIVSAIVGRCEAQCEANRSSGMRLAPEQQILDRCIGPTEGPGRCPHFTLKNSGSSGFLIDAVPREQQCPPAHKLTSSQAQRGHGEQALPMRRGVTTGGSDANRGMSMTSIERCSESFSFDPSHFRVKE